MIPPRSANGTSTLGLLCVAFIVLAPSEAARPAEARPDALALAGLIDREIDRQLAAKKITPSGPAEDAEFLRRAYLDVHGVVPPADRAIAFLDSKDPDKRLRLIDELLASSQYGVHLADTWDELLVRPKPGDDLRRYSRAGLTKWLEDSFNRNRPWGEIVSDLLTATGHRDQTPPVTYLSNGGLKQVLNAGDAAASVTRLFLGVQLQCAECHNHPFADWKKSDFWSVAAFFGKTQRIAYWEVTEQGKPNKVPKLPDHALKMPAKFLDGEVPVLDAGAPYRPVLARWITSPENPYFARAMVNRTWAQYFGRGLVNPIDDLRPDNPASHPELLELLAERFAASGFDLKYLARAIANSQAYQRTSRPTAGNEGNQLYYSHMTVKLLTGEQLYDSLVAVLGEPPPRGKGSEKKAPRPSFAAFYNPDKVDVDPTEYTRGVTQMLRSMNSSQFNQNADAVVAQVVRQHPSPDARIEHLYLRTLSRRPGPAEIARMRAFVRQQGDEASTYERVLWVLLNTSEFSLNR